MLNHRTISKSLVFFSFSCAVSRVVLPILSSIVRQKTETRGLDESDAHLRVHRPIIQQRRLLGRFIDAHLVSGLPSPCSIIGFSLPHLVGTDPCLFYSEPVLTRPSRSNSCSCHFFHQLLTGAKESPPRKGRVYQVRHFGQRLDDQGVDLGESDKK